jgi:hypothetical protein
MGVRGHGVPGSTRIQLGETKLQLTGTFLKDIVDDELIDGAVVTLLQGADRSPNGSLQRALTTVEGDPLGLIVLVGSGTVEVELGRLGSILRTEQHLLVDILILGNMATTNIQCLLGREGILLTIDDNNAVALTTVDDTNLSVVEEILVLDAWIYVEAQLGEVLQLQGLVDRHGTTEDKTVVVGVRQVNLIGLHDLLHDKTLTKGLRVIVFHVLWVTGRLETNVLVTNSTVCLLGRNGK